LRYGHLNPRKNVWKGTVFLTRWYLTFKLTIYPLCAHLFRTSSEDALCTISQLFKTP